MTNPPADPNIPRSFESHDVGDVVDHLPAQYSQSADRFKTLVERSPSWALIAREPRAEARLVLRRWYASMNYYINKHCPWMQFQSRFRESRDTPPGHYDLWVRIVDNPSEDVARERCEANAYDYDTREPLPSWNEFWRERNAQHRGSWANREKRAQEGSQ